MQHEILFQPNENAMFLGRNGCFQQHGIHLFAEPDAPRLEMAPIRQNGMKGKCGMEIPIKDIPAVIEALQSLYTHAAPETQVLKVTPEPQPAAEEKDGSKALRLEVGKTYLDREGVKVAVESIDDDLVYPVNTRTEYGDLRGYTLEGKWMVGEERHQDLVAEYVPEQAQETEERTDMCPHCGNSAEDHRSPDLCPPIQQQPKDEKVPENANMEATALSLRVGHRYETEKGLWVDILEARDTAYTYGQFYGVDQNGCPGTWAANGHYGLFRSERDIVKEIKP